MARKPGVRLSAGPLIRALDAAGMEWQHLSPRHQRALEKAHFNGYFTLELADEIACDILQQHPLFIWGEEYETAAWYDMEPDPTPLAVVIPLVRRTTVTTIETRVLVAA